MSYDLLERNQTISNMTPRLNAQLNTLPNLGTCRFCEAGLRHTFVDLGMSPALTNQIVEFIQQGCDQKTACNLAGVPYSCYNERKEKGSEGKEPYATFLSVISRARDEHKHLLIKLVMAGARGLLPRPADWRAASWLLEKGWPLEYGDRPPVATESIPASPTPDMTLVLSMPNGEKREANCPVPFWSPSLR
jgi:hypothetical protein